LESHSPLISAAHVYYIVANTFLYDPTRHYSLFQDGEKSMLTAERIKRLEDVDFFFRASGTDVQAEIEKKKRREKGVPKWNQYFGQMCEYRTTNGNCLVPKLFKGRALASW